MNPASITAILEIIASAGTLMKTANEWREAMRQNGELTPDQEAELDAKIAETTGKPHWTPRP